MTPDLFMGIVGGILLANAAGAFAAQWLRSLGQLGEPVSETAWAWGAAAVATWALSFVAILAVVRSCL